MCLLVIYVGLQHEKLSKIKIVGYPSIMIVIAWSIGNSCLGPFKGTIDSIVNSTTYGRVIAFNYSICSGSHTSNFYSSKGRVIAVVLLNLIVGLPCIAASDALADDTHDKLLPDKFAVLQYIATSILAKVAFAGVSKIIHKHPAMVISAAWVLCIVAAFVHILCIVGNSNNRIISKTKILSKEKCGGYGFLLFPPLIMKLWESIFTDVPLSSLKWVTPLMTVSENDQTHHVMDAVKISEDK